ncbi:hypothetical protein [Wolbachia endosymbiont (group A) of Scambus nigricans]|uniref:hypothetical protein n=1 Tax=Wolbachia endosymbiont (group A) of Scambus nigricans TaxID=2954055 RepID=UPI00222F8625|nr:hypothetical protein [Wolbachia endosymbiont (group A) of Scambus nigricans]
MSLKNKISELIEQQFSIKYHDNYLAYAIHKWAASEISNSIAFCIIGCGNCKIVALFTIIRTDRNMLLACYSHKHISYRIRTIIRKAMDIKMLQIRST